MEPMAKEPINEAARAMAKRRWEKVSKKARTKLMRAAVNARWRRREADPRQDVAGG